jgi:alkanesulfonate monooxygenase SsuD/methylene tetrahydromethanopterin reductase-like flavin-dependent oxidoreductase (luciferase family)
MPLPRSDMPAVMAPLQPSDPAEIQPFAELVARRGARRLWMGQSVHCDSLQVFAYLAGQGLRIPVGTGVSLLALRTPYDAAVQARSLALITGKPVLVGYGAATPGFVASVLGEPYRSARTAAGEFLAAVRVLLDGGTARMDGEYQRMNASLPAGRPHPAVELGAGVLRPAMARTAAASAHVAVTWLTPPRYVAEVLRPALAEGAADLRPPRVATVVHVGVDRPGRDPAAMANRVVGAHLNAPHYLDMLRRAGVPVHAEQEPMVKAKQLVDCGVYVYGSPAQIAGELARYRAAGVDEVVLNTGGVYLSHGPEAATADLEDILTAVEEHG